MVPELTVERLRRVLTYNPVTGLFHWVIKPSGPVKAGSRAGSTDRNGYGLIGLDGKSHLSHRLAWLYVYGSWPKDEIDHVNQVKSDNRIANLRVVDRSHNMHNCQFRVGRSGFTGVGRISDTRWRAMISVQGRKRHLGYFGTAEEAAAAYVEAKREVQSAPTRAAP